MTDYIEKLREYDAYKAKQRNGVVVGSEIMFSLYSEANAADSQNDFQEALAALSEKNKELTHELYESRVESRTAHTKLSELKQRLKDSQRLRDMQMIVKGRINGLRNELKQARWNEQALHAEVERLKKIESSLVNYTECRICLERITCAGMLSCGHVFCIACLRQWKERTLTWDEDNYCCATCRTEGKLFQGCDLWFRQISELVPPRTESANATSHTIAIMDKDTVIDLTSSHEDISV